jgi:hypothetical protein
VNIAEIIPKGDHLLYVKSDDGRAGLFDLTPFLESEAFEPLKSREEFVRIHNGRYFIEWACGADLSADTIEARWRPLVNDDAQQGAAPDGNSAALHSRR